MGKQGTAISAEQTPVSAGRWLEEWAQKSPEESSSGVRSVTEEIAPGEWEDFLANLTRRHQAWPVTVEQGGPDMVYRVQAANRPLTGALVIDSDSLPTILICLANGKTATASSCVAVTEVRRVWVKRNENGMDEALEIEAADGTVTLLHLCTPTSLH
jgi:hypothetical protein